MSEKEKRVVVNVTFRDEDLDMLDAVMDADLFTKVQDYLRHLVRLRYKEVESHV